MREKETSPVPPSEGAAPGSENRLLLTLLENTPDVIGRIDRQWRIALVNQAIEQVTGLSASDFLGRRIDGPPSFGGRGNIARQLVEKLPGIFSEGIDDSMEFSSRSPAGWVYFHTRIVPERSEDGEVSNVLTISRDISERKRAEDAPCESEERFRNAGMNGYVTKPVDWDELARVIRGMWG